MAAVNVACRSFPRSQRPRESLTTHQFTNQTLKFAKNRGDVPGENAEKNKKWNEKKHRARERAKDEQRRTQPIDVLWSLARNSFPSCLFLLLLDVCFFVSINNISISPFLAFIDSVNIRKQEVWFLKIKNPYSNTEQIDAYFGLQNGLKTTPLS